MRWSKARRGAKRAAQARVSLTEVTCAFCKGEGKDPFHLMSALSSCPACGGRKTVRVREPYEKCGACEGTGRYFNSKMYCWTCRGKGVVPVKKAPQPSTASPDSTGQP